MKLRILNKPYFLPWALTTAQSCSFTLLIVIACYKAEVKIPEHTKKLFKKARSSTAVLLQPEKPNQMQKPRYFLKKAVDLIL